MTINEKPIGERVAAVEARQDAHEARLNSFEGDMKNRLRIIEEKLDKLWWKFGLVVGAIAGAANVLPDVLKM